jgi:hypothetical protein
MKIEVPGTWVFDDGKADFVVDVGDGQQQIKEFGKATDITHVRALLISLAKLASDVTLKEMMEQVSPANPPESIKAEPAFSQASGEAEAALQAANLAAKEAMARSEEAFRTSEAKLAEHVKKYEDQVGAAAASLTNATE